MAHVAGAPGRLLGVYALSRREPETGRPAEETGEAPPQGEKFASWTPHALREAFSEPILALSMPEYWVNPRCLDCGAPFQPRDVVFGTALVQQMLCLLCREAAHQLPDSAEYLFRYGGQRG